MKKRLFLLLGSILLLGVTTQVVAQTATLNTPLTRAGAIALLIEADPVLKTHLAYFTQHMPPMPLFEDVDNQQWYAPYIETAFDAGIVVGNTEARFRPGQYITEEESIALVNRMYAFKHPGTTPVAVKEGEDWFTSTITQAVQNGIQMPSSIRLGSPVSRTAYFTMLQSMGISNPEQIAISHTSSYTPIVVQQPLVAAQAPKATRPAQQTNRPVVATTYRPPVTTTYRPPVTPAPVRPVVAPTPVPTTPVRPVVVQPRPTVVPPAPKPTVPVSQGFSISLPTLGINNLSIIHPSNPTTKDGLLAPLKNGVGHLFSYPGGGGTILVYGHSSSYAWDVSKYTKIFRGINKLSVGDTVKVNYKGKEHLYKVTFKQSVPANDLSAYKGGRGEELILYTCWPPDSIKERYLVHAVPVSEVAVK